MLRVRTVCFALLIPLLLELMVFVAALPTRNGRQAQMKQGNEKIQEGFQRLEGFRVEEDKESSFGGLLTASQRCLALIEFHSLECVISRTSMLSVQAIGWMMPLRI